MNNMVIGRKKVFRLATILGLFALVIWAIMNFNEWQTEAYQEGEQFAIEDILVSNGTIGQISGESPFRPSINADSRLKSSFRDNANAQEDQKVKEAHEKSALLSSDINVPEIIACYPQFFDFQKHLPQKYPYLKRNVTCDGEDFFKLENNILTISCESKYKYFAAGSLPSQEIFGEGRLALKWIAYTKPINIGEIEFGYVKCGNSYQAFMHNKFSKAASRRAQEQRSIMSELLSEDAPSKPLNVLIIMFDSVSRQHFYRALPKTVEFMNSSIADGELSKKFLIYDFLINNSQDSVTPPNIAPLIFGEHFIDYMERMKEFSYTKDTDKSSYIKAQDDALWKYFEQNGFVTMFGYETYQDYNAQLWGKKIATDHVATNFWHGANQLFNFQEMDSTTDCLGNHHSNEFMLNYTQEFVENYKGHNKFAYLHLMTGHEQTGSLIKTIDSYLKDTLERILSFTTASNEDIAIFLTADHGQLNKFEQKLEQEYTEIHLPYTFLIANRELLAKIGPKTHEILTHNTKRLVGKLDWHLTIKQLALAPYKTLDSKSTLYNSWKAKMNTDHPVSLFAEMVKDERTCEDIRIPSFRCTCRRFNDVDYVNYAGNEWLVNHIAQSAVDFINGNIKKVDAQEFCNYVSLDKVLKATYAILGDPDISLGRYYKIDFSILENSDYVFRTMAYLDDSETIKKTKHIYCHNSNNLMTTFKTKKDKELSVIIDFVRRADNVYGLCDKVGEAADVPFQHCICKDPATYTISENLIQTQIKVYENIKKPLHISFGHQNESCLDTCTKLGRFCDEWGMKITSRIDLLEELWREDNSYQIDLHGKFVSLKNLNRIRYSITEIQEDIKNSTASITIPANSKSLSCEDRWTGSMSICPCSIVTIKKN